MGDSMQALDPRILAVSIARHEGLKKLIYHSIYSSRNHLEFHLIFLLFNLQKGSYTLEFAIFRKESKPLFID